MLPELNKFDRELSLVMNSGIQFIDFALNINWKDKLWREKATGNFVSSAVNGPLRRLLEDKNGDGFYDPSRPGMLVRPEQEISVEQSFKLFDAVWLPIPVLRTVPPDRFDEGPYNWARVRIVELAEPDQDGNTHRITFAFDTKVFPNSQDTAYLAPTAEDIRSGVAFGLAYQSDQMSWFLDFKWINEWLLELFHELAPQPARLKLHAEDLQYEIEHKTYQGHFLNILAILGTELTLPRIKVVSNKTDDIIKAIPVDMVLDVGNSRTCGILIEDHEQEKDGLKKRYELELRDLNRPEQVYYEPFESRIEFAQASFGKDHFSVQSGRRDAFQWATIARVGKEAARLASRREGNEGSTGLSSPKRYLWDIEKYEQGWRFNSSYVKTDYEPYATAEPLSGLINEFGEALHSLRDDVEEEFERKMPVFQPKYSRSSLMMFMLSEVLMQALMQINSPAQRGKLEHSRTPRFLRSIILTIPPAMPKPEREIFKNSMYQAIGLVWKSLGWDKSDDDLDFTTEAARHKYWPILPEVYIQWDEATCGQVVYFFNETQNNYGGRPEEFIAAMVRPDKTQKERITIASVDIGGGTTDLVINDYALDYGENSEFSGGSNAFLVPTQRFRDGFKVAGDDILLDIVRDVVLSSLTNGLKVLGLADPEPILSELIGKQALKVQNALLRQQLTLQVFSPIGLRILKEYEQYNPFSFENTLSGVTFADLLSEAEYPTESVLNYINEPIRRLLRNSDFNIMKLPIKVDLRLIHQRFIKGDYYDICKTFTALCEVINSYQCDVLLLTGRPSRLPGIQSFFKSRVPLPVGRILPLHHYRTGGWYPFHKQGRIEDPKTTAAVGAMLCFLSQHLRLPNFNFRSASMRSYSTVKYLGLLDNNNVIKDSNVYYKEIDLDNDDYDFPDTSFEVRGFTRLGFRQLNVERWTASPLYTLDIINPAVKQRVANGISLTVTLGVKTKSARSSNKEKAENFYVKAVSASDGASCRRNEDIKLALNTMTDVGLSDTDYWLDSGSVKR
ncbi:virulence factor SrfB [Testudinibacter sp. TR-2022]|uniref:virulence factor SrfB n=1 Tax=Testudinibacter sp. TR-2022 TaxID=2585029 RepID=UPI001118109D|nr:virulence factor SrfB [Testudinibacter sp. TR-2022]TNH03546.1 virulence factor SrfB [Pasteurellaceae bacterium Phil31]TNH09722.1 virulence factor SrfB [Testudinibacter sp. TR-2022]TNH11103.1 virulence factor SrfB [Testudinibacter sp. TR-2022]TNH13403.1 virulence factor SrfB [Testudinibacter sp. TR-2022]TNH19491.1 virulence factor SrfB [Testudinibacter sp. TR-2022]